MSTIRRHSCGGVFADRTGTAEFTIRGETVQVERDEMVCQECGEIRVLLASAEAAEERAGALVRARLGILQPDEIRSLRSELGFTQEQLELALGLGAKTVVRWETGRVMQNKATDNLLRLIQRDPSALECLYSSETSDRDADPWPSWTDVPLSLRRRLIQRARAEDTDLRGLVLMILGEQLTLDGVNRSVNALRIELSSHSTRGGSDVEDWLKQHKDQYETAS